MKKKQYSHADKYMQMMYNMGCTDIYEQNERYIVSIPLLMKLAISISG